MKSTKHRSHSTVAAQLKAAVGANNRTSTIEKWAASCMTSASIDFAGINAHSKFVITVEVSNRHVSKKFVNSLLYSKRIPLILILAKVGIINGSKSFGSFKYFFKC